MMMKRFQKLIDAIFDGEPLEKIQPLLDRTTDLTEIFELTADHLMSLLDIAALQDRLDVFTYLLTVYQEAGQEEQLERHLRSSFMYTFGVGFDERRKSTVRDYCIEELDDWFRTPLAEQLPDLFLYSHDHELTEFFVPELAIRLYGFELPEQTAESLTDAADRRYVETALTLTPIPRAVYSALKENQIPRDDWKSYLLNPVIRQAFKNNLATATDLRRLQAVARHTSDRQQKL